MAMQIVTAALSLEELKQIAGNLFGDMVKGVVDVDRQLLAVDAELHSDLEALLLENGSDPESLWGINIYPEIAGDDFIEFDSLINIRPSEGNSSRGVKDESVRRKISDIVKKWLKP
jgi:hypothetical protein